MCVCVVESLSTKKNHNFLFYYLNGSYLKKKFIFLDSCIERRDFCFIKIFFLIKQDIDFINIYLRMVKTTTNIRDVLQNIRKHNNNNKITS